MGKQRQQRLNKRMVSEMYADVATDAYPSGATFACAVCDYYFDADAESCAEYFIKGWPRHCDELMTISEPVEE